MIARSDASVIRRVPTGCAANYLSWAPDGKRLAYETYINEGLRLVVSNLDGTERRVLGRGIMPDWRPR